MKYKVLREHYGEKFYAEGDEREANPNEVKHLINNGVLTESIEESGTKPTRNTKQVVA